MNFVVCHHHGHPLTLILCQGRAVSICDRWQDDGWMTRWVLATIVCIAEVGDGWRQSMLAGEHSHHMPAWLIQCGWIHEIDTRKGKYEICWKYLVLAQNINIYRVSWYLSIFIGTSEMRHLCVLKFNILNIMKWWHIVTLNINITTVAGHWPAGQWRPR